MFPSHERLLLNTTLSKKNSASFYWPRGIFTALFLYPCDDQPAFHPQTLQSCDILPLISFTSLPEFPWTSLRNLSPLGFRWPSGVYHSQWGVPTPATPAGFEQGPKWKPLIFLNETKNLDYNHRFRTIIGSTLLYLFLYIFFIWTLFFFDHLPLQLQWNSPNSQHPSSSRWGGGKWVLFEFGMFFVRLLLQRGLGNFQPAIFSAQKSPRDLNNGQMNGTKHFEEFCGSFHESWRRERCNSNLPWVQNQLEMLDLLNLWGISYIPTSTATFCRSILLPLSASSGLQRKPPSWHSSKNPRSNKSKLRKKKRLPKQQKKNMYLP